MIKSVITGALALSCVLFLSATVKAQNQTNWQLFSKGLIQAVDSDNYGAKLGAIQQIAIYGSNLHVNPVVFDVVRVYRNSKNENERILALSALAKMRNAWAMDFLARSVPFEKSARVRRHTIDVVNAYRLGKNLPLGVTAWESQLVPPSPAKVDELLALK